MDRMKRTTKILSTFSKYRYAAIVLLIGVLLMLLPGRKTPTTKETVAESVPETLEERLEQVLSTIEGVGEIRVLLTIAEGERVVYQSDLDTRRSGDDEDASSKTVLITDNQRGENGLVQQTNPPSYLGAIISCQGADNPAVELAIVDAVSTATGLGADRISVMKMK